MHVECHAARGWGAMYHVGGEPCTRTIWAGCLVPCGQGALYHVGGAHSDDPVSIGF